MPDGLNTYKSTLTGPELDAALRNIGLVEQNIAAAAASAEAAANSAEDAASDATRAEEAAQRAEQIADFDPSKFATAAQGALAATGWRWTTGASSGMWKTAGKAT